MRDLADRCKASAKTSCCLAVPDAPYAFFGELPEKDYLPTAWAIALFLGWRLYDPQRGEDLGARDLFPEDAEAVSRFARQALGNEGG